MANIVNLPDILVFDDVFVAIRDSFKGIFIHVKQRHKYKTYNVLFIVESVLALVDLYK